MWGNEIQQVWVLSLIIIIYQKIKEFFMIFIKYAFWKKKIIQICKYFDFILDDDSSDIVSSKLFPMESSHIDLSIEIYMGSYAQ